MKVLVIEDMNIEPIKRQLERFNLDKDNLDTDYAMTGKSALDLLEKQTYDLIILDYSLPDMNGNEMIREIKSLKIDSYLIGYSAHWQEHDSLVDDWTATGLEDAVRRFIKTKNKSNQ